MKTQVAYLLVVCAAGIGISFGQSQSTLDLLRSIQPGQPANTQTPPAQIQPAAPAAVPLPAPTGPSPVLDTKPMFMSIITNYTRITNPVIVTNYVVVTKRTYTTNYFNAHGQQLIPLPGSEMPVFAAAEAKPAAPAAPDPAVVHSNKVQALRNLLTMALTSASNTLAIDGSFTSGTANQIRIPEGVTVFDRKKAQALTTAMNVAAEKAAPAAFSILRNLVAQLNPSDPVEILEENGDAATRYLVSAQGQKAVDEVLGVVQTTAAAARVPEAYNAVMLRGGGLLGAVLGTAPSVDMNSHITRGLMEAIITKVGAQENAIRTDPAVRTSAALKDAFTK